MTNKNLDISEQDKIEFSVNDKDVIFIQRQFLGKTQRDIEIENLPIPKKPILIHFIVKMIRFYQKSISKKLGNRCVFDPSCSHYSELAFRKKGVLKGAVLTIKRLCRCRPKNGGVDDLI
jgi:putative membrane protein insertion efficiency factor